jgi:uncharacterized membrane protein YeaQ/YmgE (transglycosylase-associated protein family)
MGLLGFTILIVAALLVGLVTQFLMKPKTSYDWLFVTLTTGVGAYLGSQWLVSNLFSGLSNYAVDGLVVIPAVIAGLIVGAITEAVIQVTVMEPAT